MTEVADWHQQLHGTVGLRPGERPVGPSVSRFRDIDARITQPALDADVLAIHLGGPKRVIRRQGPHVLEVDVPENAITVMPVGEAFRWETFGPIDFAHLRLDARLIRELIAEDVGQDPDRFHFEPLVGVAHHRLARFFHLMLSDDQTGERPRLEGDSLSLALSIDVLKACSENADPTARITLAQGKLATWQLRRIVDYMREHLAEDIEMDSLIALTGLGRARFFQAFRNSMGCTPFAHLLHLRLLHARFLLVNTSLSMTAVAMEIGLSPAQFSVAFRRAHGTTPRAYRATNTVRGG